jgi:hypothetical protein
VSSFGDRGCSWTYWIGRLGEADDTSHNGENRGRGSGLTGDSRWSAMGDKWLLGPALNRCNPQGTKGTVESSDRCADADATAMGGQRRVSVAGEVRVVGRAWAVGLGVCAGRAGLVLVRFVRVKEAMPRRQRPTGRQNKHGNGTIKSRTVQAMSEGSER